MYIYLEVIGPNNSLRNNGFESSTNLSVPINSPIAHNYGNNVTTTKRNADRVSMDERDEVIGYLSGHIAQKITKKFVNINQDLSREIYAILKNNDLVNSPMNPMTGNIRITCIPASDIIHFKYNTNPKTHRGVSDLAYSILPATMWCWLTMNFVLGTLTRGQDRRIYYAKPSIDTNVASMMLNTIDQLKRGNYGVRQIENINNIFGILGRYTDLLMPLSLNGEQPIQIDVMKGQDIDPHQEMLDKLEEYAVNMSEINIDMISTHRQMDYAIQATMTSNTTAQMVTNRQDILSEQLGNMITMLYNYEYDENIELGVNLPEPVFLKSNNNAQIVQAVISEAQTTAAAVYPDEIVNNNADKGLEKAQFIKLFTMDRLKRHYSSAYIEELMKRAEVEAKVGTSSSKESE